MTLQLTKMGLIEEGIFAFDFVAEMIIGRDPMKTQLAFADDGLLSSKHCRIFAAVGKLYLEDLGSTNGTYLNGVPVHGRCLLEQDDVIMAGSMELRLRWTE